MTTTTPAAGPVAALQALPTARTSPDKPAVICDDGSTMTFGELADRASRLAGAFRQLGLAEGDVVAVFAPNSPSYLVTAWACRLAALYYVCLNSSLGPEEIEFIVNDSGASVVVASTELPIAAELDRDHMPAVRHWLAQDGALHGWEEVDSLVACAPHYVADTELGGDLLQYSSGTTGRPKGIRRPLRPAPRTPAEDGLTFLVSLIGATGDATYLCPAPLYHTAPNMWTLTMQRIGATVVLMRRFEPVEALELIEKHRVTHGQFVPTMFTRMLKLPAAERRRHDVSSLRGVVHAAAPCPLGVKQAMIDWWGPIVHEYWSSSEGAGFSFITAQEWLERPGSVGRSLLGPLHICDPLGTELATGEVGVIWAEGIEFDYLNDAGKNRETTSPQGWRTVGDIGRLDEDGYLYLTDRANFMIITGGVNIYPQEAENLLVEHPGVADAAVVGIPDDELGEIAVAVVQPLDPSTADCELAAELTQWCEAHLARYKVPRRFEFTDRLPRSDSGKLFKRQVRDDLINSMKGTPA